MPVRTVVRIAAFQPSHLLIVFVQVTVSLYLTALTDWQPTTNCH